VLNPFAVYFDPDSVDVISRMDAQFVDVVHWLSADEIIKAFPASKENITAEIKDRNLTSIYEHYDKSANRKHEDGNNELNGKHKVVERYYRVSRGAKEELWLAVWAPGILAGDPFLFNGRYHVQPIDPDTGKAMFPIVELVSDCIMGESDGFVKLLKDPVKLISVLYTQVLDASKHSGRAMLVDRSAFRTGEEFERAKKLGANANIRLEVNDGRAHNAIMPVPAAQTQQVDLTALQYAQAFAEEVSSTTKAMQGVSEGSTTAASLNAQRIEQSSIQLSAFFSYYKQYLQQTLKLRYAYWRESYTDQMAFRLTMPNGGQENFTLNQMVPQAGWDGQPNGEVSKINDISAAKFDVVISDSFQSPSYRKKMTTVLTELLQNPAIAQNPNMAMLLVEELFNLSDAPQDLKDKFKQQAAMQQQQMQMPQQQQQQMQGAA
jgi:hypothetical protein